MKQADELRDLERKTLDAFRTRTNTKNNDIMSDRIIKNERKKYASDLTDSQWEIIKPLLPKAGKKSKWEKRELINAVLYLLENGCKWRTLPYDFPPHTTVSNFYYAAGKSGLWEKLLAALEHVVNKL